MNIQFFSLFSAIKQHSLPESYLAKALSENGHNISYINCGKVLKNFCIAMSGMGIKINSDDKTKESVCNRCNNFASIINDEINSNVYKLDDYISATDRLEIDNIMLNLNKSNCVDFTYIDVPVGRLASYEVLLHHKKMNLDFQDKDWIEYKINFENCLIALKAYIKLFKSNRPDTVVIYSPQYGVNGVIAHFLINNNIKVYFIEGGSSNSERYKSLRIWDFKKFGLVNPALSYWQEKKNTVTLEDIKRVKGHILELLKAKSHAVYSESPKDNFNTRKYFNIGKNQKIILASLSSFDEAYAAYVIDKFPASKINSSVYPNQFEWIKDTIDFVERNENLFLIIRVHPRDYKNKRDSLQSEQSYIWENILKDLPSNVVVNSPLEKISIYNLFLEIDILLTGWSATGVEAMLYGVPVVTYDKNLPSYPSDIHFTGCSREEYYKNIFSAINYGRSKTIAINAYKWTAFNFSKGVVRTPQLFLGDKKNYFEKIILKFLNNIVPNLLFKIESRNNISNNEDLKLFLNLINARDLSLYDKLSIEYNLDKEIEKIIINSIKDDNFVKE